MGELMFIIGSFASMWGFAAWLACAFFAGHITAEKNRCGFCWFCWGLLFGPISLIASVGLPMRQLASLPVRLLHLFRPIKNRPEAAVSNS